MPLDYRTMEPSGWVILAIIIVLCLIIAWVLFARPMIPWRSTQRWRAPTQSEEELGEPTPSFCRTCKVIAVVVLLMGVLCVISPMVPAWRGL